MGSPTPARRKGAVLSQQFPNDEFDEIPYNASYFGTHRADLPDLKGRSQFKWIAYAGLAALIIGAFSFFILPTLVDGSRPSATAPAPTTTSAPADEEQTEESSPTETAATDQETTTDEETGDQTEGSDQGDQTTDPAEPTEDTETPANVDYSLNVEVYQTATATQGADEAAGLLRANGFTVPSSGMWQGNPVTLSTVFYADETQRDTAQAVADHLGISNVEPGLVPTVVVILSGS